MPRFYWFFGAARQGETWYNKTYENFIRYYFN